MKKTVSCLLLCAVLLSALSVGVFAADTDETITADTSWYDEAKAEFTLTTAAQLAGFNQLMADGKDFHEKTVKLGADIDMENFTQWNSYCVFTGTFDGQGHSISNLSPMTNTSDQRRGMFGYASGTICNFTLVSPNVGTATTNAVGAIVGDRNNEKTKTLPLTIEDVHVVNGTVAGNAGVGGILGNSNDGSSAENDTVTVRNCSFQGTVAGVQRVGGIVGYSVNVGMLCIENCKVDGTVTGSSTGVGGIVGHTKTNTEVTNCIVQGTVSATGDSCGGLVGLIQSALTVSLDNCYATVTITGAGNHKGGLVGQAEATVAKLTLTIKDCLAEGKITLASDQEYMAGLVGRLFIGTGKSYQIEASFESIVSGMACVSNQDGSLLSNFKGITSIQCDSSATVSLKLTNVYADSDQLSTRDLVNKPEYITENSLYGAKTFTELQALKLTGWTNRLLDYPIPSSLIEGKTFVVGEQTKADADGTIDYRFVAVWNPAQDDTLENYTDIGFFATLTNDTTGKTMYQNQKVSCQAVYTAVSGTTDEGEKISYTPDQWGGAYLFVLVLESVEADASFTLQLTPYTTDTDGNDSLGWKMVKKKQVTDNYAPVLEGVTVNAIGDSYFAGNGLNPDDIWLSLIAKKYGMTMNNYGKNGLPGNPPDGHGKFRRKCENCSFCV